MSKLKWLFFALPFILLVALVVLTYLSHEFLTPVSLEKESTRFVISEGMRGTDIANELQKDRLIRHAWAFRLLVRVTSTGPKIKAGTYDFSPNLSPYQILKKMVSGDVIQVRVTIPEGYTLKQIADLLDAKGIANKSEFLDKANQTALEFPELKENIQGLEGFLFPDTYDLAPHLTPEDASTPMVDRFKELVIPLYGKSNKMLSLKETITLASLVERESRIPKEYPLIAAVYTNRLRDQMPLQCDATIQYLLPVPKELLSIDDLKIESPYNTYLHSGLPPGPIGSPGLLSIKAALAPAHVPYLYYVARGDGSHIFSITYSQHLNAVEKYRQWLFHRNVH